MKLLTLLIAAALYAQNAESPVLIKSYQHARFVVYGDATGCTTGPNPPCPAKLICWYRSCQRELARIDEHGKVVIAPGVAAEEVIRVMAEHYEQDVKRLHQQIEDMRKLPVQLMPNTGREDKI